jgi:hypothetical protein
MATCSQLVVALMGDGIEVESEEENCSIFTVDLGCPSATASRKCGPAAI